MGERFFIPSVMELVEEAAVLDEEGVQLPCRGKLSQQVWVVSGRCGPSWVK